MADAKPQELDPALVEKVARAICLADGQDPDAMDAAVVCDLDNNPLPTWQAYEDESRAALLSLPIPAAALNALAKGEAVVVPKARTREMITATPFLEDSWDAQLAASPYAGKDNP